MTSPSGTPIEKSELIEHILAHLSQEVASLERSAQAAHEAATHEESKAEDHHDTRGLEASYLAGAQAARVAELQAIISNFQFSKPRNFSPSDPIAAGALVELDCEGKRTWVFLVVQGGGLTLKLGGSRIVQVITPQAPLGDALLGKRAGEAVEVEGQKQSREYEVVSVR